MASTRVIDDYLSHTREVLEWHPEADLIVAELADHLHQSAEATSPQAAVQALGAPMAIALSWAATPYGGMAIPTRWTRRAGAIGVIAGALWVASAGTGVVGLGNLVMPWSQTGYMIWSLITISAVLATVLLFGGAVVRGGGRRDGLTISLVVVSVIVLAASVITWAWIVFFLPLAVAAALAHQRLRDTRIAGPGLFAVGWPLASAAVVVAEWLAIGRTDLHGGHPLGNVLGYTLGALVCAVMTASLGARLWRERPVAWA